MYASVHVCNVCSVCMILCMYAPMYACMYKYACIHVMYVMYARCMDIILIAHFLPVHQPRIGVRFYTCSSCEQLEGVSQEAVTKHIQLHSQTNSSGPTNFWLNSGGRSYEANPPSGSYVTPTAGAAGAIYTALTILNDIAYCTHHDLQPFGHTDLYFKLPPE